MSMIEVCLWVSELLLISNMNLFRENIMTYDRIKFYPFCDQGWIIIVKEISIQKLHCCTECETEWGNP